MSAGDVRKRFQPKGKTWEERAKTSQLRAVIDPSDYSERKNRFIDYLHESVLNKYLTFSGNETVLDFGCGTGRFTQRLCLRSAFVEGIDITRKMINGAQTFVKEKNVGFLLFDGMNIPFREEAFDLIISVWVLQYADEYLGKIAENLIRSLKRTGKIVLIEQVEYGKKMPEDYISAFEVSSSNCKCILSLPIRKSPSIFVEAVRRGLIPRSAFPLVLRFELYMAKKTPIQDAKYEDYLFIFERKKEND